MNTIHPMYKSVFFFFFLNRVYCPSRRGLMLDFTLWYATPPAPNAVYASSFPGHPQYPHRAHPE